MVIVHLFCHNSVEKAIFHDDLCTQGERRALLVAVGNAKTLQRARGIVHEPSVLMAVIADKCCNG